MYDKKTPAPQVSIFTKNKKFHNSYTILKSLYKKHFLLLVSQLLP